MTTALVCGLGTVGLPFALALPRVGVDHLVLVDFDRVEARNVAVQPYLPEQVGMLKVEAARALLRAASPVRVDVVADDVRVLGIGALARADLLVACPDNRAAELALGRAASLLGRPYLRLATAWRGASVTLVPRPGSDGEPCSGCLLTADDVRLANVRESCLATLEHNPDAAVPTSSPMGALAAALAADAVSHAELAPARLITLRGGTEPRLSTTPLTASPGCRLHPFPFRHGPVPWRPVPATTTLAELVALAAATLATPNGDLIAEADVPLCPARVCGGACGRSLGPAFMTFTRQGLWCPDCGGPVVQEALPARWTLEAADLLALGRVPLAALHPPAGLGLRFASLAGATCGLHAECSEAELLQEADDEALE